MTPERIAEIRATLTSRATTCEAAVGEAVSQSIKYKGIILELLTEVENQMAENKRLVGICEVVYALLKVIQGAEE